MTYLDWLAFLVCQDDRERTSYQKLFAALYDSEFIPIINNDENRASDGLSLRNIFKDEMGIDCQAVGPCSLLEMFVAMALRCENDIMYDPDEGDRTGIWFWEMMGNMGLDRMDDWGFDANHFNMIVQRFNTRTYDPDGYGGPFYISGSRFDMRKIELWYQMNYYICDKFM